MRALGIVAMISFACGCSAGTVADTAVAEAALTSMGSFGGLNMYSYVPSSMPQSAPLVLALPGCGMTAADYVGAGWNELADLAKVYVVYAEVPGGGCFSWTASGDTTRGSGQALALKQMIDAMKAKYSVDGSRVFVTGLSAGGAMTTVMLATYPDVFAAGAPMAGVAYGSSLGGGSADPNMLGNLVRNAFSGYQGPYPRVSVWQGQSDSIVAPSNATNIVAQWTNVHGQNGTPTGMDSVSGAMHASYAVGGQTVVESYLIPNMGHGTALKIGFAPAGGCGQAGSFLLDAGICSTYYAAAFFGLLQPAATTDGGSGTPGDLALGGNGGNGGNGGLDGGGAGGGGGFGGGTGGSDAGATPTRMSHSGCSAAVAAADDAGSAALLVLLLLGLARRRARR